MSVTAPAQDAYLVISTVTTPVVSPTGSVGLPIVDVYYIGSFVDQASAQAHADEHNKQVNTVATVQTLVNPANC